ncbi:preprotein translocase subunit SecG [Aliiroseovarius sp.]|uniref:preprotein translocase subunit SecG n=1 Tax=Aliiroseovarius sp. TaxID=1872442 RepID=UPI003BA94CD2
MENVVLVVHLLLALGLIGVVLLQRSEGGGLGIGGGSGGVMSARGAATALSKITWGLAIAFLTTSIGLTIIAAQSSEDTSVVDITAPVSEAAPADEGVTPPAVDLDSLLPPATDDGLAPPRAD